MPEPTTFAFYGTLMNRAGRGGAIAPYGRTLGPCIIPARMYSVSDFFPAVILDPDSQVHGELWEPRDGLREVLTQELDIIESYYPDNPGWSLYRREAVVLREPDVTAWVYVWNSPMDNLAPIPSGRWQSPNDRSLIGR